MNPVVIADYLRVTHPEEVNYALREALPNILLAAGFYQADTDSWKYPQDSSLVVFRLERATHVLSVSGRALHNLRAAQLLQRFAWSIQEHPHTVTRLDTCHDTKEVTSSVIPVLRSAVYAGTLRLSRNIIQAKDCHWIMRRDPEGRDTGTLYVGSKDATCQLKVYDKRMECIEKRGEPDYGPLTRYELKHKREAQPSLRDVCEPAALHWSRMPQAAYAHDPVEWTPGQRVPWSPMTPDMTVAQRMHRILSTSDDINRLKALAARLGEEGKAYVMAAIDHRIYPRPHNLN